MTALALASSSLEPGVSRPARKENRIVAFFRSRSRSRSRPRAKSTVSSNAAQSTTNIPTPASKLRISHVRSTSLAYEPGHAAHASSAASASQSNSKPGTRISTRPISSTTTATHSTITPLPSDSIRRRQRMSRHVYSHDYTQGEEDPDHQVNRDQAASQEDHDRAYRSNTPSSLNQRRKLELRSIFGIALSRKSSLSNPSRKPSPGSSDRKISSSSLPQKEAEDMPARKRSFRLNSRPNTPKSTDESRVTKTSTSTIPTPSNPLPLSASPRRLSFGLTSSSRTHTPTTSSGHLPLALPSRHKRHSVGSHDTAHDSAVALPDDHSDSALTSSSRIDTRSNSKTSSSTLSRFGKSRKGKEQERDVSSSKPRSQTRKTPRMDDSRPGIFGSLSEETSPIISLSPPPQNDSRGKYDLGGLVVSLLPTVESMLEEDAVEQPLIRAPQARPAIPQIIHTPPTPQRTAELDSPVRPATTPPTLSGGQGKPREVLLSKDPITVHSELPKLHARTALSTGSEGDLAYNRMRSRFSPRLFGGKDLSRESKKQKPGSRHDPPGGVGPPRNMTNRRIKHGSFDFERPVSGLNRSSSTVNASLVNASLVKGEGITQSSKTSAATHRPSALERTASSSSDRTGKSRKFAYHPTRADSPILAQLSASHTGETSVVSFSSASASAQSKSTGKSAPGPSQSSSWGRASGRRTQRTSHGPFPFEPASSVTSSPLPTSSALPPYLPSPNRQEFDIPEGPASFPPSSPLRSELGFRGGSIRDNSQGARSSREQGGEKKGKGRSLDLKLGLSWAPNRVRQEAIIHGSLLSQKQEEEHNRGKDVTKVFENVLSESGFETFKKYVHRFDAHLIPLEGPRGLLARVEKLLIASSVSQTEKVELLDQFARFVEGHSEV